MSETVWRGRDSLLLARAVGEARARWGRSTAYRCGRVIGEWGIESIKLPATRAESWREHFRDGVRDGLAYREKSLTRESP